MWRSQTDSFPAASVTGHESEFNGFSGTVAGVVIGADFLTLGNKDDLPGGWIEGAPSVNWFADIKPPT